MAVFWLRLFGRDVEGRMDPFGAETVRVDGSVVSQKRGAQLGEPHSIIVEDQRLRARCVEIGFDFRTPFVGRTEPLMTVSVDAGPPLTVPQWDPHRGRECHACGYSLAGLDLDEHGGSRCPECQAWTPFRPAPG